MEWRICDGSWHAMPGWLRFFSIFVTVFVAISIGQAITGPLGVGLTGRLVAAVSLIVGVGGSLVVRLVWRATHTTRGD